jgi:glycosyltransferase involved in cell wall biosynthesis
MNSKVTIAIPTLNRATYLKIALDSALSQTYRDLEIVVSNNASADGTATLLTSISDPRLRVIEQKSTLGMMENWNACLSMASGKYFLLLSDDDILEPAAIEEMVNAFEDSERHGDKIGFVYCNGRIIDQDGITQSVGKDVPSVESARRLIVSFLDGRRNLWPCAILFRKVDLSPGYDTRLPLAADAAQWMRVAATYGTARFVSQRLARYRVHQNASMKTRADIWRRENSALGNFAIEELQKSGEPGEEVAREIRKAVRRLNARITFENINHSLRHEKRQALVEYWKNREAFAGFSGLTILAKGIFLMMLPDFFRAWVRRRLYS